MGDGKTVVKGGYGRFNQLRELQPDVTSINLNGPATTTWDWHDNNGNKLYQAGEVNLDPNGSDYRSSAGIGGNVLGAVNPNEKQPKTDEFSATFERELRREHGPARHRRVFAKLQCLYAVRHHSRRSVHDSDHEIPIRGPMARSALATIRASRSPTTSTPRA